MASTVYLVLRGLSGGGPGDPVWAVYDACVVDETGAVVAPPGTVSASAQVGAGDTAASLLAAAGEAVRASLAQNLPEVDITGLVVAGLSA
jgi:hypothetical protein